MMRTSRRALLGTVPLLVGAPCALAQAPADRPKRLVILSLPASVEPTRSLTLPELARLGFAEGRTLAVTFRTYGSLMELPALVAQIVSEQPDVIFSVGGGTTRAMAAATRSLPIVFFGGSDPIAQGFAETLSRPGRNLTGLSILNLEGKRLDLLHQALPAIQRIAVLRLAAGSPSDERDREASDRDVMRAAAQLGLSAKVYEVGEQADYASTVARIHADGAQGLLIGTAPRLAQDAAELARLAREAGLPTVCQWASMARRGCLIGYGPDIADLFSRAASYIARILRGVPPGEIPIEEPRHFSLGLNLGTAQALGLALPPTVTAQADEVFE